MASKKKAKATESGEETKERMSAEEFVTTWQKNDGIEEFCEATGLSPVTARSRAVRYRKAGVELKEYPRRTGGPRLDVDALNELVK